MSLRNKIIECQTGICLYGLAPPKLATPPSELSAIVAQQQARLAALPVDGLIVYDLQDEAERTAAPRPFPFLPTLDPHAYAHGHLGGLSLPKIVYRCVSRDSATDFHALPSGETTAAFSSPATDAFRPFQTLSRFRNSRVSLVPGFAWSRKWKWPAARFGEDRSWS